MSIIKKILMGCGILFVGLVFLGIIFGATSNSNDVSKAETQNNNYQEKPTPQEKVTEQETPRADPDNVFTYTTYSASSTKYINEYTTAPSGYEYLIINLKINNQGEQTYNTNPYFWDVIIDGVTYNIDTANFDQKYYRPGVQVGPGGKTEFNLIYLVPDTTTEYQLNYKGF